ncbi:DMT family transporter [Salimicrobium humidisoli]|uniref:QacE family quaternary ammonium compound efflux SMR transporter n=1 Tax=Salimicrobium humidisoli TaxID=2029857 RepID=A0ABX4HUY1_9BACI|nr:multidrug efflux SMR transporter [Salimicrobium humidisoli]PBB07034.1 QacE family quaternary ammonium compound efflux SMR transporter [Salimicrobium humidisoli]
MSIHWFKIIIAGLFEIGWVIGLKHADSVLEWTGTVIAIVVSFYYLIMAGQKLPAGTAYAVFVGIGTVGTVLSGMLLFGEAASVGKVLMIALLLTGIIGLKMVTPEEEA